MIPPRSGRTPRSVIAKWGIIDTVKINLSKKQYETMIKAVEAGSSIYGILGDMVSDDYKKESNEIEDLQKYLLGFASDFGSSDMTEKFKGELIMSDDFSEKMEEVMDDYDDEIFWHELETRLGKRDFERTMTKAEKKEMEEDRWYPKRIHELYDKWSKEFEDNGVERLEIVE